MLLIIQGWAGSEAGREAMRSLGTEEKLGGWGDRTWGSGSSSGRPIMRESWAHWEESNMKGEDDPGPGAPLL